MKRYLPAMLLLLFTALLPLPLLQRDGGPGPVAVVFGPGVQLADAYSRVVAAGGHPLSAGPVGSVVVARFHDPDFSPRIRSLGAWLLLSPLAAGCGGISDG